MQLMHLCARPFKNTEKSNDDNLLTNSIGLFILCFFTNNIYR